VAKIFSLLKSCETVFSPPVTTSNNSITHRLVTWSRPMEGTVCLNVDGSLLALQIQPVTVVYCETITVIFCWDSMGLLLIQAFY
jgi:hypothetical protein